MAQSPDLRDLFALHAPREIPSWFEPEKVPLPAAPNSEDIKRLADFYPQREFRAFEYAAHYDERKSAVLALIRATKEKNQGRSIDTEAVSVLESWLAFLNAEIVCSRVVQRTVQWPYAWADFQMAQRGKTESP